MKNVFALLDPIHIAMLQQYSREHEAAPMHWPCSRDVVLRCLAVKSNLTGLILRTVFALSISKPEHLLIIPSMQGDYLQGFLAPGIYLSVFLCGNHRS